MKRATQKVVAFLNSIGIRAVRSKVPITSFLPGIRIRRGVLFYYSKAIAADLLHEAAHVAIVPAKYRILCSGDMDKSIRRIWNAALKAGEIEIDSPIYRQVIQASEAEAIAWSWAAGNYVGLSEEEIITNDPTHFNGEGAEIRNMLKANCHFGINGLRTAGMVESVKTFPRLTRWTQP